MDYVIEQLCVFLSEHGLGTIVLLIILMTGFAIANAENLILIRSDLLKPFSYFIPWAKKKQVSSKIRGTILKAALKQVKNNGDIIPTDLKVVWVNKEESSSFVNNNQVIVRIKQSSNPDENLATAVSEYVNNGLLYNVRRYLHPDVMKASKTYMARKIIQSAGKTSLAYFDENYIIPKLKENEVLRDLYERLVQIDHNGMFVGILLNEFNKAGMSIYGEVEDPELVAESKEFMNYLYDIAIGISDDYERLCFNRDYFKVAIFLTASNKTLKYVGIKPFIRAISKKLDEGIETIYVFGLGAKREVAQVISQEANEDIRVNSVVKHSYRHIGEDGRRVSGVFYECCIYKE